MKLRCLAGPGLSLVLAACGATEASPPGGEEPALRVVRGELREEVLLTGELVAGDNLALIAPNANVWPLQVRWLVESGSEVAAGDRVVEFDSTQLTSNLEQLRATLLEVRNKLDSLRAGSAADVASAEFEVERQRAEVEKKRLAAEIPRGLEPEIEYQRKQLELERARLDLENAEKQLAAKRESTAADVDIQRIAAERAAAAVAKAESGAAKLTLRAPRAGLVILEIHPQERRLFQVGDSTWPGVTMARMPDLSTLEIEAQLFDVDDRRVRPGMAGRAYLDAFPAEELAVRVRRVDQVAQQLGRRSLRRTFQVTLDADGIDAARMRPGMSVKVVIARPLLAGVLLVPRRSLAWRGGAARARLADGSWCEVELGACGARSCVVEQGLDEGQRLAAASEGSG